MNHEISRHTRYPSQNSLSSLFYEITTKSCDINATNTNSEYNLTEMKLLVKDIN